MTQDIRDFVAPSCELLALGEPTHRATSFARARNTLFARLVGLGFRSIALETDRVTAFAVDDFVRDGVGTLDAVMDEGFTHGFGALEANRRLVAWMRAYNEDRPAPERLAFHGFDIPTGMTGAPSPRPHLAHARAYLDLGHEQRHLDPHAPDPSGLAPDALDLDHLAGPDERWSAPETAPEAAAPVGAGAEARELRAFADDLLLALHARAPELIASTSRAAWFRAEAHLTTGIGLLRYHRTSALPGGGNARFTRQLAARDALMAQNLLAIRTIEAGRGRTLVFSHNLHLQRNPSRWHLPTGDLVWSGAGAIVGSLLGERYAYVAGSLGLSEELGLPDPRSDTYEGLLQSRVDGWGLAPAAALGAAHTRTDTLPEQGYSPLDRATVYASDAVLHIGADTPRLAFPFP
ncbi:erythromycin esterase family protein [Streptomyces sp. NPDC058623]|uniref:erythromycin esterase family protein n=1 Tax=Streptomyces sp. NPDC058623 TaxID=3346563 RepID=UPI003663F087